MSAYPGVDDELPPDVDGSYAMATITGTKAVVEQASYSMASASGEPDQQQMGGAFASINLFLFPSFSKKNQLRAILFSFSRCGFSILLHPLRHPL